MIIARLNGQLGNQMFVYATAYALSKIRREKLVVYKFEYDTIYRSVGFQIGDLKIVVENYYYNIPIKFYKNTIKSLFAKFFFLLTKHRISGIKNEEDKNVDYLYEKPNTFTPIVLDESKTIHSVEGFRQSPLYFDGFRNDLINLFQPNYELNTETKLIIAKIHKVQYPVSLHIRRGDYVKIGCCLSMDYYKRAISYIKECYSNAVLFIFSDDIQWVKQNLDTCGLKCNYMAHEGKTKPFDDIWAMSKCKANIIANSSFSWWAAYLNTDDAKLVIAPRRILDNNNEILPKDWHVIDD